MHLRYRNELIIVFYVTGPLGNIAATYGSRGNSRANSRTGSKENLCEDCVQNPLDLVDASIQVEIRYLKSIKFLFYFAWLLSVVQLVYSWNLLRACFTPIKPWACQMLPLLVQCHHCIFEHIVFLYRDLQEFTTDKLLMERQIVLIVHLFRYKENLGFIG